MALLDPASAAALTRFVTTPLADVVGEHLRRDPAESALQLFRSVVRDVPAYRAFLSERGLDPDAVRSPADLRAVPATTKDGYLRRHALPSLCRGGRLDGCDMVAVSSGSTGEPTFFPRGLVHELAVATRIEQVFHDAFDAATRRTLAVVCFPLGTWVGGMYTAGACRHLAAKGYPLMVVTPGNQKPEIMRAVRELGPLFDQVVLLGYPPFLKDVIDSGRAAGLDWPRYSIRLVLAGEVFSEAWRAIVGERAGIPDTLRGTAALYGTADAGVLGNETPLSIAIRRFAADRPHVARALFGSERLPTLVQYDPLARWFEEEDGALLFSGDNGIPLVRYRIGDSGGVLPYEATLARLRELGFDPASELGPNGSTPREMPFVYVFGRSYFAVSFYGANVFPETVSLGLEQPAVRESVTGKFVLEVVEDADHDRRLAVLVELGAGVTASPAIERAVADAVLAALLRQNPEFGSYVPPERREPRVTLRSLGDPDHFPVGVKHRYVRK